MEKIISIILPVILILGLGMLCRKKQLLNDSQIDGVKSVSVKFLWPAVLFYAFFTAHYGKEVILYAAINFVTMLLAFLLGFFLRKRAKSHAFSYPYLMSGLETGMIGYPLYGLLFQNQEISYLALLDVGHALFIFPIFLSYMAYEQSGSKEKNLKKSFLDMLRSPIMIALIVGMICGISGFGDLVMTSGAGEVIDKLYAIISNANTLMILLAMGYSISFTLSQIRESMKVIVIRLIYMAVMTTLSLLLINAVVGLNKYLLCAVIVTFIMPPVYMLGLYVKDKKENEFCATTASMYTVISIIAFIIMTIVVI